MQSLEYTGSQVIWEKHIFSWGMELESDLIEWYFEQRTAIMAEFHDSRLLHHETKTKEVLK